MHDRQSPSISQDDQSCEHHRDDVDGVDVDGDDRDGVARDGDDRDGDDVDRGYESRGYDVDSINGGNLLNFRLLQG